MNSNLNRLSLLEQIKRTPKKDLIKQLSVSFSEIKNTNQHTDIQQPTTAKNEYAKWLQSEKRFDWMVTLTFRIEVTSKQVVMDKLHNLASRVNRDIFGQYGAQKNQISFIAAIEEHTYGDLHVHLLLRDIAGNPFLKEESLKQANLAELVVSTWQLITRSKQSDIKPIHTATDNSDQIYYLLKQKNAAEELVLDFYKKQ